MKLELVALVAAGAGMLGREAISYLFGLFREKRSDMKKLTEENNALKVAAAIAEERGRIRALEEKTATHERDLARLSKVEQDLNAAWSKLREFQGRN